MQQQPIIRKASGEEEQFSPEKLKSSLKRAGAKDEIIDSIMESINDLLYEGITTRKIYNKAFVLLRKHKSSIAAQYSLKKAIMQLGPTGYPFEHFVAQLMACEGYEVSVGKTVQGNCITHEVDVVATGNNIQCFIECKFHNNQGKFSNVQVPLYIRSRVDDIIKKRKHLADYENFVFQGWVVTNTRFTSDAIDYGICAGLNLIGWDFPKNKNLRSLIKQHGVFPITALTHLTNKHKKYLMEKEVVLCRQLLKFPKVLNELPLSSKKKQSILEETEDLCIKSKAN